MPLNPLCVPPNKLLQTGTDRDRISFPLSRIHDHVEWTLTTHVSARWVHWGKGLRNLNVMWRNKCDYIASIYSHIFTFNCELFVTSIKQVLQFTCCHYQDTDELLNEKQDAVHHDDAHEYVSFDTTYQVNLSYLFEATFEIKQAHPSSTDLWSLFISCYHDYYIHSLCSCRCVFIRKLQERIWQRQHHMHHQSSHQLFHVSIMFFFVYLPLHLHRLPRSFSSYLLISSICRIYIATRAFLLKLCTQLPTIFFADHPKPGSYSDAMRVLSPILFLHFHVQSIRIHMKL